MLSSPRPLQTTTLSTISENPPAGEKKWPGATIYVPHTLVEASGATEGSLLTESPVLMELVAKKAAADAKKAGVITAQKKSPEDFKKIIYHMEKNVAPSFTRDQEEVDALRRLEEKDKKAFPWLGENRKPTEYERKFWEKNSAVNKWLREKKLPGKAYLKFIIKREKIKKRMKAAQKELNNKIKVRFPKEKRKGGKRRSRTKRRIKSSFRRRTKRRKQKKKTKRRKQKKKTKRKSYI